MPHIPKGLRMITKAIFPVAGFGTRFLPATKATPKEMLPILDKPLIQYAVNEAIAAGITNLIFVTNNNKRAIEDYFDQNFELEAKLVEKQKLETLQMIKDIIPRHITCTYVRQQEAKGLGHAISCAKHLISSEEFFAVLLADDYIDSPDNPLLKQMTALYEQHQKAVIATTIIPPELTHQYGIVKVDDQFITKIVEKPATHEAPSNQAVLGRYILPGSIFNTLAQTKPGSGGEIQLTDAIARQITKDPYINCPFTGHRFDCGSRVGYLQANIHCALQHPDLKERMNHFIQEQV